MIRIKDSIFNENEIVYIMEYSEKELQVMFKNNNDIYIEATFEDIEWNCDSQERQYNEGISMELVSKSHIDYEKYKVKIEELKGATK